jgi:hypothetical protein
VGAALVRVTVPVELTPPATVVGLSERAETPGAVTAKVAVADLLPVVAVIVSVSLAATAEVLTVNVAVVAPAATDTEDGTWEAELLDWRETEIDPPVGAGPFKVTVPVDGLPPTTEVGLTVTLVTVGAWMVNGAVLETGPSVALMFAVASAPTALVVIVNVPVFAPAAIVTDPGTVALALSELSVTTEPPVGAGELSVRVPVEELPPRTVVGFTATVTFVDAVTVKVAVTALPAWVAERVTLESATIEWVVTT